MWLPQRIAAFSIDRSSRSPALIPCTPVCGAFFARGAFRGSHSVLGEVRYEIAEDGWLVMRARWQPLAAVPPAQSGYHTHSPCPQRDLSRI
jgi:hypothetical protein